MIFRKVFLYFLNKVIEEMFFRVLLGVGEFVCEIMMFCSNFEILIEIVLDKVNLLVKYLYILYRRIFII